MFDLGHFLRLLPSKLACRRRIKLGAVGSHVRQDPPTLACACACGAWEAGTRCCCYGLLTGCTGLEERAVAAAGKALIALGICSPLLGQPACTLLRYRLPWRAPHALYARTSTLGRRRTFTDTVSQRDTDAATSERGQRHERQREDGPQRNSSAGPVAMWEPHRQRRLQRQQEHSTGHWHPHLLRTRRGRIYSP